MCNELDCPAPLDEVAAGEEELVEADDEARLLTLLIRLTLLIVDEVVVVADPMVTVVLPPVIVDPVIGIGFVMGVLTDEDSTEEVPVPFVPWIPNLGEALPEEPMRTTI